MKRFIALASSFALVGAVTVPVAVAAPSAADETQLRATISYTDYGVPHITAPGQAGIGYGVGYAKARDHLCMMAEVFLAASGEMAAFLGDRQTAVAPWGTVESDAHTREVIATREVEQVLAKPAPWGPDRDVRELVRGYAAGYNRYLREGQRTDPACKDAAWVRPVTEMDVFRSYYLGLADGVNRGLYGITTATPPGAPKAKGGPDKAPESVAARGSNAIAVGSQATTDRGGSVLLANPHVPWHGPYSFWQARTTVPGKWDVDGAQLVGSPVTYAGYTKNTAWMNTISAALSYNLYELKLVPGDPTSYLVDGRPEKMIARTFAVPVLGKDGKLSEQSRTIYSTRYGQVLTTFLTSNWRTGSQIRDLPWTTSSAYVLADANFGSLRGLNVPTDYPKARSAKDILRGLTEGDGMPYANTIAVDKDGWALFAGVQAVPHVTDELAARCNTPLGRQFFAEMGLPVLDGSRAACAWGKDRKALVPGTFGPQRMPVLLRKDFVTNSNDSHWLTNPDQQLRLPRIFGVGDSERSARTRMGLLAIHERLAGVDGLGRRGFDLANTMSLSLDNRSSLAEISAKDVTALCRSFPDGRAQTAKGEWVEVGASCTALANWDRRYNVDSRGGALFDEFWTRVNASGVAPWVVPFNVLEPVTTPNTLNVKQPKIRTAFADAVAALAARGVRPDAALGDYQYVRRDGKRLPIHGGRNSAGVYNMINTSRDQAGNVDVGDGTSFLMVVEFDGRGCPEARTLLASSQSSNPLSKHHADQTARFSAKQWLPGLLCAPGQPMGRARQITE